MGNPPQPITVQIDTGDSDLWVNSAFNPHCKSGICQKYGTFNPKLSNTPPPKEQEKYSFSYYDDTSGTGVVYKDTIAFGSLSLEKVAFGLVTKSNTELGALGLGYYQLAVSVAKDARFPTFTQVLVNRRKINLQAYSIFLNQETATVGSIIFGGIDKNKISGKLVTLPIQLDDGKYQQFFVRLQSVTLGTTKSAPIDAILDTGTPITYIQYDAAVPIWRAVNVDYDSAGDKYVSCDLKNSKEVIKFEFDGRTIQVRIGSFVSPSNNRKPFRGRDGKGEVLCPFGIGNIEEGKRAILGANFIRSAYLVYDLDNNQISIAQASYSRSASNIIEIPVGGVTALDSLVGLGPEEFESGGEIAIDTTVPTEIASNPGDELSFVTQAESKSETGGNLRSEYSTEQISNSDGTPRLLNPIVDQTTGQLRSNTVANNQLPPQDEGTGLQLPGSLPSAGSSFLMPNTGTSQEGPTISTSQSTSQLGLESFGGDLRLQPGVGNQEVQATTQDKTFNGRLVNFET